MRLIKFFFVCHSGYGAERSRPESIKELNSCWSLPRTLVRGLNDKGIYFLKDESGIVLPFTALVLPVILLIGLLVLQSGELYRRQAQLQFVARQAANSALVPAAGVLKTQAEVNYESTCNVEFPPGVCGSDNLFDFLNLAEAQGLMQQTSTRTLVQQEGQNFSLAADPKEALLTDFVTVEFPYEYAGGHQAVVRVSIAEPQTNWLGNLLSSENYQLRVEAQSFLSLDT